MERKLIDMPYSGKLLTGYLRSKALEILVLNLMTKNKSKVVKYSHV